MVLLGLVGTIAELIRKRIISTFIFSYSADGGKSFKPDIPISEQPSCPATDANGYARTRWPLGGDYSGLAASPDNQFHVFWVDARSCVYQPYTVSLKVK